MKVNRTQHQSRTTSRILFAGVLGVVVAFACSSVPTIAQDDLQRPDIREMLKKRMEARAAAAKKAEEPKKDEPKKDEKPKEITAVVGADIYTVTNEVIRRGTILIQDGKIKDVGQNLTVPDGAKVIDAKGKYITPGFIAINAQGIALRGGTGTRDKLADHLDPFDRNIKIALGVGITTGCMQMGRGGGRRRGRNGEPVRRYEGLDPEVSEIVKTAPFNPDFGDPNTSVCQCCGLPILPTGPLTAADEGKASVPSAYIGDGADANPKATPVATTKHAIVKMSYGSLDSMIVAESGFFQVSSATLSGGLNRHNWRNTIAAARKYLKDLAAHEAKVKAGDKKSKAPRKPVTDELLKLVKKEIPLRVAVSGRETILAMVDLAEELDYRLVLDGVTEGWLIPDEIAEVGASVVITPRSRRQADFAKEDSSGSNVESSRIYEEAGVPFAVATLSASISLNGLAGRDLTALPLDAAFALRGGCSEQAALASITIEPARMMGLEDRIGSIEKGKDADILILNGTPLDYRTYVETAMVNGRTVYDRNKDKVYPVFER